MEVYVLEAVILLSILNKYVPVRVTLWEKKLLALTDLLLALCELPSRQSLLAHMRMPSVFLK